MTMDDQSIEWPCLENYSDQPAFNTKAVVQRTGVPAPTLRAWERRYALLSPERAENAYRLYSERDIALIRWLKERVDRGMAISQAVAFFRYLLAQKKHLPDVASAVPPSLPPLERVKVSEIADDERTGPELDLLHRNIYPTVHNMQSAQQYLIECFQEMDEQKAQILMGTMFTLYPVEQICIELITPTMQTIGQLWAEGSLTVSVEHFASNFFRALLTNLLHVSPLPAQGPLVLAGCAPGEPHELAILMLSLLLRRKGMRVVYLGQSIETAGILHTIRKLKPAALCISITIPTHVTGLEKLARQVTSLSDPRPIFIFGGRAFHSVPYMIAQVAGVYLEGNLRDVVAQVNELVCNNPASDI